MKTQEEIEQLAESAYPIKDDMYADLWSENNAFKKGYTKCQEDNKDKKYTEEDMRQAMICVIVSNSIKNSKDITEYIAEINKQD